LLYFFHLEDAGDAFPLNPHGAKSQKTALFLFVLLLVYTDTLAFYWAHLSRFHLKTETESIPRNIVF
jgi:hypothetical protein